MKKIASIVLIITLVLGMALPSFADDMDFSIEANTSKNIYLPGDDINISGRILNNDNGYSDTPVIIKVLSKENNSKLFVKEILTDSNGEFNCKVNTLSDIGVGEYTVEINAVNKTKNLDFSIQNGKSTLETDKNEYYTGSDVVITGTAKDGSEIKPYATVIVKVLYKDNPAFVKEVLTDKNGDFEVAYDLKRNQELGEYIVQAEILGKTIGKSFIVKEKKSPSPSPSPAPRRGGSTSSDKEQELEVGTAIIKTDKDGNKVVEVEVDNDKLMEQLDDENSDSIIMDVNIEEDADIVSVRMKSDLISKAKGKGKKIVVNTGENIIEIDPSGIDIEEGSDVKFDIKKLSEEETNDIASKKESDEYSIVSTVYDYNFTVIKGDKEEKIKFSKPIKITTKLNTDNVSNYEKVGIYYYNEETEEWEYIGGKADENGKLVFKASHFSKYGSMEYNKKFGDVDIVWANEAIEVLTARHIIDGVGGNKFAPYDNITRAAFSKLIVEALDLEAGENNVTFEDVESDKWYTESIEIAASLGIVTGYDGKFNPNAEISREAMSTMVVRALEHVNPEDNYVALDTTYSDKELVSDWAKDSVSIATAKGLINGVGNNKFAPESTATRAESAVVVYRLLKLVNLI